MEETGKEGVLHLLVEALEDEKILDILKKYCHPELGEDETLESSGCLTCLTLSEAFTKARKDLESKMKTTRVIKLRPEHAHCEYGFGEYDQYQIARRRCKLLPNAPDSFDCKFYEPGNIYMCSKYLEKHEIIFEPELPKAQVFDP